MDERERLEKRVAELEKQVAAFRGGGLFPARGVRKRADWGIGDIPFYDIAFGADAERGELRGHARGVIAIGDLATGFLAIGGLSRGVIALGGLAAGVFSFGGLSIGLLSALGGLAIGGVALGGFAAGGAAIGGAAVGHYACAASAQGTYVLSPARRDPEAEAFFSEYGLEELCPPGRYRTR